MPLRSQATNPSRHGGLRTCLTNLQLAARVMLERVVPYVNSTTRMGCGRMDGGRMNDGHRGGDHMDVIDSRGRGLDK